VSAKSRVKSGTQMYVQCAYVALEKDVFPAVCIGSKMTEVGQEVIGYSWIFIELVGKVSC